MSKYKKSYSMLAVNRQNKYASGCGASGGEGNKGFQPGNTCGGDGDGSNTSADQGGGDAKTKPEGMPRMKPRSSTVNNPKNLLHNRARDLLDRKGSDLGSIGGGFDTDEEAREFLQNRFDYNDEQLDWLQYGQYGEDAPDTGAGEGGDSPYKHGETPGEGIIDAENYSDIVNENIAPYINEDGEIPQEDMGAIMSSLEGLGFDEGDAEVLIVDSFPVAYSGEAMPEMIDYDPSADEGGMSQEDKHLDERIKIDEMEEAGDIDAEEAAGMRDDLDSEMGMGQYAPEADTDVGEQGELSGMEGVTEELDTSRTQRLEGEELQRSIEEREAMGAKLPSEYDGPAREPDAGFGDYGVWYDREGRDEMENATEVVKTTNGWQVTNYSTHPETGEIVKSDIGVGYDQAQTKEDAMAIGTGLGQEEGYDFDETIESMPEDIFEAIEGKRVDAEAGAGEGGGSEIDKVAPMVDELNKEFQPSTGLDDDDIELMTDIVQDRMGWDEEEAKDFVMENFVDDADTGAGEGGGDVPERSSEIIKDHANFASALYGEDFDHEEKVRLRNSLQKAAESGSAEEDMIASVYEETRDMWGEGKAYDDRHKNIVTSMVKELTDPEFSSYMDLSETEKPAAWELLQADTGAGEGGGALSKLNSTDRQMAEVEIQDLKEDADDFEVKSELQEFLDNTYGSPGEGVSSNITDAIWEGIGKDPSAADRFTDSRDYGDWNDTDVASAMTGIGFDQADRTAEDMIDQNFHTDAVAGKAIWLKENADGLNEEYGLQLDKSGIQKVLDSLSAIDEKHQAEGSLSVGLRDARDRLLKDIDRSWNDVGMAREGQ